MSKKVNITKETLYDLYIVQQMTSKEVANLFNCTSKTIRNKLYFYDIPVRQNSEAVKLERSKWSLQKEQNRSRKFIITFSSKSKEEKELIAIKKTKNINTPSALAKSKNTKFMNGTYKTSKSEDSFYKKLELFIDSSEILRGYVDDRYPFNCDFYVKSLDLFIEYQGHPTHGTRPFNANDLECVREAEMLQQHGFSLNTYKVRDVNKLNIAKRNKINLLLIYPRHDSYFIKNGNIKNIGKFDITKINELC